MTKRNATKLLNALQAQGFDTSYTREGGTSVMVDCSQCAATVINGLACHETGCPNHARHKQTEEGE